MGRVTQVTPGGVFRVTWVSSGATANPIVFNLFSGSETMVNCWAGVSSGNGAYYADIVVGSRGLWKGSWLPYVSPNSYRYDEYFLGAVGDTDQPGRYVTWDDVQNRFANFADTADAVRAASHYVSYAEAFIDGRLAVAFTTPFSNNNMTVKDLVIDVVQMRAIRGQNNDEYKNIRADVNSRLAALIDGSEIMILADGSQVPADATLRGAAWSSTQDYHPTFSPVLPDEVLVPSSGFVTAESDDRGLTN